MKRNVFVLFGVVAVLLTATVALTLPRATLSAGGVVLPTHVGTE
jgi:hypothetical protein